MSGWTAGSLTVLAVALFFNCPVVGDVAIVAALLMGYLDAVNRYLEWRHPAIYRTDQPKRDRRHG